MVRLKVYVLILLRDARHPFCDLSTQRKWQGKVLSVFSLVHWFVEVVVPLLRAIPSQLTFSSGFSARGIYAWAPLLYIRVCSSLSVHYGLEDCDSSTILLYHACPSGDHSVGWYSNLGAQEQQYQGGKRGLVMS